MSTRVRAWRLSFLTWFIRAHFTVNTRSNAPSNPSDLGHSSEQLQQLGPNAHGCFVYIVFKKMPQGT